MDGDRFNRRVGLARIDGFIDLGFLVFVVAVFVVAVFITGFLASWRLLNL